MVLLFPSELPEKYVEDFKDGIKVEIRFEHSTFSSNVILLCLRVVELGQSSMCDAKLFVDNMPVVSTSNQLINIPY